MSEMIPEMKPDKFDYAAAFTFHPNIEGGYVVDQGGPTNYGMTQNFMDAFNRQNGYPMVSVKDLTQDDVKSVSKLAFYDAPGLGNLPDRISVAAFDYSMNSGAGQAIKDLQRVVGAKADGILGPQSYQMIQQYIQENGEDALIDRYINRRKILMEGLIMNNPAKHKDSENGWNNRLNTLRTYLNVGQNGES